MGLRAGKLNKRVTIQQVTRTSDGGGGYTEAWAALATVWANVEPQSGSERWTAGQQGAGVEWQVTIRYRDDVTPLMRVLYGSKVLNIRAVMDPDARSERLVLVCEEEEAS